jgi:glycosyltransferase involved in cell wall biosynthesis
LKHIVFTVTNDLSYDQRMQRICTSLAKAGYCVLLVGRKLKHSLPLKQGTFRQKRLRCFFNKKFLFYTEYNLRLFFYLLFIRMDAVCAIDLDTILPCLFVSSLRNKRRIYDAHELFTEMKEVITRPGIKKMWLRIEKYAVPKFAKGYTVSLSIADELKRRYNVSYAVIRNLPLQKPLIKAIAKEKIVLYQGAVNEARGLENLVDAMQHIDATLHIYGHGNIYGKIKALIKQTGQEDKIFLKGKVLPEKLQAITGQAYIGINLVEPLGLNQLYSLSNKFFDYIQAGIPQLTMNFPEYKKINELFHVAVLADTVETNEIAEKLNLMLLDPVLYGHIKNNCLHARDGLHWEKEEEKLVSFYNNFFST